ncbi:MAG: hypothetical protein ACJKTH_01830 [Patescibacteria group bacterium UBA2163]
MNHLRITQTGTIVGILSVVFFFLCMAWGLMLTDPILKELHVNLLRIALPGFSMSLVGFIIGAIESFIYGWVFGALFSFLHKKM